jgi:uncharacterized protein YndB with AHSA1/START domain
MVESLDVEIKHSTLVRAAPEKVYDALTKAEHLDSWFTTGAVVDARPGGKIEWRWVDWGPDKVTTEDGGPVLEAERGKRLVFQWRPDNTADMTTCEIDFEKHDDGTVIRLREHGYKNTPEGRAAFMMCSTGWGEALTMLKYYVEHGVVY